jgi:hypothetical protein
VRTAQPRHSNRGVSTANRIAGGRIVCKCRARRRSSRSKSRSSDRGEAARRYDTAVPAERQIRLAATSHIVTLIDRGVTADVSPSS